MLHELTIYLDENHCENKRLLAALASVKVPVERHLQHFPPSTPDTEWLPFVGAKGWAVVTTDKAIRKRALEKLAVEQHCVSLFCFTNNRMSGEHMANAMLIALPRIRKVIARQPPPFTATISPSGAVEVYETFGRQRVDLR